MAIKTEITVKDQKLLERLVKLPKKINLGLASSMHRVLQALVADVKMNRLSKVRSGKANAVRVPGTKVRISESGAPIYPQALSVVTGRLRQSIVSEVDVKDDGKIIEGKFGTNVFYAQYHEKRIGGGFGPRAFLGPALRDMWPRIVERIEKDVEEAIKE